MIKSTSVLDAFTERNSKHPRPDHFPSSLKPEMCLLYPTGHWNNNNFNINSNSLKNYLLCDLSSLSLLLFGVTDYWVHCSPGASSNRILCLPCRISPSQTIGGGVLACLAVNAQSDRMELGGLPLQLDGFVLIGGWPEQLEETLNKARAVELVRRLLYLSWSSVLREPSESGQEDVTPLEARGVLVLLLQYFVDSLGYQKVILVDAIFLNFFILMIHKVNIDFIPSILCLISIIIISTFGLAVILIITIIKITIFKSSIQTICFVWKLWKVLVLAPHNRQLRSHDLTASKKINLDFHHGGC